MSKLFRLTEKEFIGQTVPKDVDEFYDYKRQGSYKIHIPELMPHLEKDEGIWCKNHTNKWNITPSDLGEYGSHYPLQPGTYVIVKFFENDINAGYVDRILSDYKEERDVECQDCVDAIPTIEDRDEQYLIFKTPKKWDAFYVNEDTLNEPNTIYLIYNRDNNPARRTVYRIDETGIHVWTRDNIRVRLLKDENEQIDQNSSTYIKKDRRMNILGNYDSDIDLDSTNRVKQNRHFKVLLDSFNRVEGNYHSDIYLDSTNRVKQNRHFKVLLDSFNRVEGNYHSDIYLDSTNRVEGEYHNVVVENSFTRVEGEYHNVVVENSFNRVEGEYHFKI